MEDKELTFKDLGIGEDFCEICESIGWSKPTAIQKEAIPPLLKGKDVMALAETGSGKTAAFGLPMFEALLKAKKSPYPFALVLTPTRELALQIHEQFNNFCRRIGAVCSTVVGGVTMKLQAMELRNKKHHIIVATPGRLVDLLEKTKCLNLRHIQYLVLDEGDRLLEKPFSEGVNAIMERLPKQKQTLIFSATMTTKVQDLQQAHLNDPIKVEVSSQFRTVSKLKEYFLPLPEIHKAVTLVYLIRKIGASPILVFVNSFGTANILADMLSNLNIGAMKLHGKMRQDMRCMALKKFESGEKYVLVATDVASRGLDFSVDYVINYDFPESCQDYIHRVGRTARAGKWGVSITFVTQYKVLTYMKFEKLLGKKLEQYPLPCDDEKVLKMLPEVEDSEKLAKQEFSQIQKERREEKVERKLKRSGEPKTHNKKRKRN